eukprot:5110950-Amphidinium_carterae.1
MCQKLQNLIPFEGRCKLDLLHLHLSICLVILVLRFVHEAPAKKASKHSTYLRLCGLSCDRRKRMWYCIARVCWPLSRTTTTTRPQVSTGTSTLPEHLPSLHIYYWLKAALYLWEGRAASHIHWGTASSPQHLS